jgi:glucose-6-phosphate isomerase
VTTFAVNPGPLAHAYDLSCQHLDTIGAADALWRQRIDIWADDPDTRRVIANRLGWLRALDAVTPELPRLRAFAAAIRAQGYERVLLMGIGGSSLAPEVLRAVAGVAPGFPRFVMLDTVNPDAVRAAFADPARTLYIVASKSGTTIEPVSLAAEAKRVASAGTGWGAHAMAITDPGTALHLEAVQDGYREVFVNPPDIGGRYSALSLFGMVPAALMGADLDGLVASARAMERECRRAGTADNAGLALGALMAAAAANGRDKLTLLLPPAFAAFGLWVEQLVAESTGKHGAGIVPITGEPPLASYGADRCFVEVTFAGAAADPCAVASARASGAPWISIDVPRATDVAAEFLRWEVATAIAGLVLGVNPFDEPNVKQAKDATTLVLDAYVRDGRLPFPEPHAVAAGAHLTFSGAAAPAGAPDAAAAIETVRAGDYLALLAYVPPGDAPWAQALDQARALLAQATGVATTSGYGPRYLHSTGQLHKGGPNTGVFVVVAAKAGADLPVPGQRFSFGVLEAAQALGDFQSLDAGGRRAVYIRLPTNDPAALAPVIDALARPTR